MSRRRLAALAAAALAVGSGWTRLVRRRRHARRDFRLFVLEYHDVTDGSESEGTVGAARFAAHLEYLKRHFKLVSLAAGAERLAAPEGLNEDLVVITFDDGYVGNYEAAWPALRAAGIPATIFVTTGFLDGEELWVDFARRAITAARQQTPSLPPQAEERLRDTLGSWPPTDSTDTLVRRLKYTPPQRRQGVISDLRQADLEMPAPARPLSWAQVSELQAGGIEIGAHTVSHPILSTLEPAEQEAEILSSRDRIAEATGITPTTFAYPNGSAKDFDRHSVEILARAGFLAACTTRRGSNRPGCDLLTLKRLGIGSDPISLVEARLAGLFDEEVRRWLRR